MKLKYIAIIALLFSTNLFADEASHRKLADKLVKALKVDVQVESMATNLRNMQAQQFSRMDIPAEAKPMVKEYLTSVNNLLSAAFKTQAVRDAYSSAYMKVLTEKEISDALVFFNSPVGKKYLAKTPAINRAILGIAEKQMTSVQPKMAKLQNNLIEKLRPYLKK